MIRDYAGSKRPPLQLIGKEALAVLGSALLMPFGIRRPKRKTVRKAEQRTVVFVHGYLANAATFYPLRAYLYLRGIPQVLFFNYRSSDGVEAGARQLKEYLRKHVRGGRIDLVCHSLGGLVARAYLQDLGGHRRVDRCVTLATPHKGTYNAYWLASRIGREVRPDSPLIERLSSSKGKSERVRFTSIVAGSDNIIIPRVFSANEETIHVPDLGHVGLTFSPTVFRIVAELLTKPLDRKMLARVLHEGS